MAIKLINGQLVDTSTGLTGGATTGNNSFSGINPLPTTGTALAGYGLGTGSVPFGTQPSPIAGQAPIPATMQGTTIVKLPPSAPAPISATTPKPTVGSTAPTRVTTSVVKAPDDPSNMYNTATGAMNPNYPGYKAPLAPVGSVASLYQAPAVSPDQAEIDRLRGIAGDTTQETDPNVIYQKMLTEQQAQIDSINNVYNDQLNNARIKGQGRLGSTTALNARSGLLGSDMGQANTANQENANTEEQNAINHERMVSINSIYSKIKTDAKEEAAANKLAKSKGADAQLEFLTVTKPALQKKKLADAVKSLVLKGIDPKSMSQEEKDSYTKGLGISFDELDTAFNTGVAENNKLLAEQQKLTDEGNKRTLENEKLTKENALIGKMSEKDKAQLAFDKQKLGTEVALKKWETVYGVEHREAKDPSAAAVTQFINKQMATPEFKGMSKSQKADFILANGGTPSDYEY